MRTLAVSCLLLSLAVGSHAQGSAEGQSAPDLVVLKWSWQKERIGWERDPFAGAVENFDDVRVRTRNERRIEEAKRGANTAEIDRIKREARADAAIIATKRREAPPRYVFMYKISVKNTGAKTIKAVDWDYIFLDAETHNEIGRRQFTSEAKIGPGKNRELDVLASAAPTDTISVHELREKERVNLNERVVVMRILYTDGSVWAHP